jgi:5'-3' exoribonuclease 1
MTSPSSPIISFYPETFRIDLEGKRADWEGIVLVPFIDEERLLAAEKTITPEQLTKEERSRNVLGSILIFTFSGDYLPLSF